MNGTARLIPWVFDLIRPEKISEIDRGCVLLNTIVHKGKLH